MKKRKTRLLVVLASIIIGGLLLGGYLRRSQSEIAGGKGKETTRVTHYF